MRWPFRRNQEVEQTEVEVPSEIQEYYQAERRERAGMAWLLGLGTLVVTVLLAVGLFFGGRWVYRKVMNNDRKPTVVTNDESQSTTENKPRSGSSTNDSQSSPSSPAPTPNSTPSPGGTNPSSPSTTPPTSNTTPTPPSSQSAAGQSGSIPNTGPGDVIGIAATVTIAGALGHSIYTNRRGSRKL